MVGLRLPRLGDHKAFPNPAGISMRFCMVVFISSSHEWLVIAGANAKVKGMGTINGEGEYRFMLTATDGDLLGGGTIKIRKAKK